MRRSHSLLAAAAAAILSGCTFPGQRFDERWYDVGTPSRPGVFERVAEEPPAEDFELIALTPAVIAELAVPYVVGPRPNPELAEQLRAYRYTIGPQDILTFTVWDHPELTIPAGEYRPAELQGHLVGPDGTIFFPYIGIVQVGGRTLAEVRDEVSERLARFIQDPQLDVRIAAFRSKRVYVTGEVSTPGVVPITDVPLTLVEALSVTGGATPEAALQGVQVIRDGVARTFDVQALLERGDMTQNLLLRDGDVIYVPESSYFAVHVMGEVKTPGVVRMTRGRLNLAEAITLSGGFDPETSDPARVLVFRNGGDRPVVYWLDAKSPHTMLLATQFQMQPQDVVFVASTGLARWNRLVSQILPTVQTLWQTQNFIDRLND